MLLFDMFNVLLFILPTLNKSNENANTIDPLLLESYKNTPTGHNLS